MVTMIKTFFRHFWESLKSVKRNGWMSFASISAVTITLLLVGIFLTVILNVTKLADDVAHNVNVTVFLETKTTPKEMEDIEEELQQIHHVKHVEFSSKDDQLQNLTKAYGNAFNVFEGDANPLRDAYILQAAKPEDVKKVKQAAETIANVEQADYGGDFSDKVVKLSSTVKKWGLIGSVILLVVAIFLISNTIRLTIVTRKREIQIMRLVGAKNGFIRWPFFLEGAEIGLLGSLVPIAVVYFGYTQLFTIINRDLMKSGYSLLAPHTLIPQLIVLMAVIGILIGSLGSVISMRRFLKI